MKYILAFLLFTLSLFAFAQKQVVNEEINITKEREIAVPKSVKLTEKIPSVQAEPRPKTMNYSFYDRKPTGIEEFSFSPVIVPPNLNMDKSSENPLGFNNYIKIGAGNYGRIFGEGHINSSQNQDLVYGLHVLHNSTRKGPVDGNKSALSISKIALDGKYHQNSYEVKLNAGYENRGNYFYGYNTEGFTDYTRADLRQRYNLINFDAAIENTLPKPKIDYSLASGIQTVSDYYSASEFDWGSRLKTFFPVFEDQIKAYVNAEAYYTQMSDNQTENPMRRRTLLRLEPGFSFDFGSFSAKLGVKAVSQSDPQLELSSAKAYPSATVTYKLPSLIYIFAGIDGDVIRNTMRSLSTENPWVKEQLTIRNTYKNQEYFIGTRGDLFSGLSFNIKAAYSKLDDLYYFDQYDGATFSPLGTPLNVTKYDLIYDENRVDLYNASVEFGYSVIDVWKPNLKFDYYYYNKTSFDKPYHRPAMNLRFGNNISITDKLVSSVDLYYIGGIFARNVSNRVGNNGLVEPTIKLKDIIDLNTEFTYLFNDYLSAFVSLNNIFGRNYERYFDYPQLGLNFLAGINIAL